MTKTSRTETVRIADAQYGRPFRDERGKLMVDVWYDDGDRFVTYGVRQEILNAWAEVDVFGKQLTEADV